MSRHQSRVVVMQSVYQWKYNVGSKIKDIALENIQTHPSENLEDNFIIKSITEIKKNIDKIEKTITIAAPDWPIDQIDQIDLAILVVGVYELLFREDIPPKVAIDEAVELGKEFGGDNTAPFVNGVLGTVFRASDRYEGAKSEIIHTRNKREKKKNKKKEKAKDDKKLRKKT